jgi:hypothetical protein
LSCQTIHDLSQASARLPVSVWNIDPISWNSPRISTSSGALNAQREGPIGSADRIDIRVADDPSGYPD